MISKWTTGCPMLAPFRGFPWCLSLLEHRQHVAGRVLEPGDVRALAASHALLVLLEAVVALEADPLRGEFVDRLVDVVNREVQDGVVGRRVTRLRVDQRGAVTREVQGQQAVLLRSLQAERPAVELFGFLDVIYGEPAKCLGILEHECLLWSLAPSAPAH